MHPKIHASGKVWETWHLLCANRQLMIQMADGCTTSIIFRLYVQVCLMGLNLWINSFACQICKQKYQEGLYLVWRRITTPLGHIILWTSLAYVNPRNILVSVLSLELYLQLSASGTDRHVWASWVCRSSLRLKFTNFQYRIFIRYANFQPPKL